ncbi:MAG TPA: capsule assembly Wzi family protein [Terracidiphilus sp.]|jgi:hypothetical protein
MGSPYVTVDSWIYPAMMRLYSLGFLDHVFLDMRPWPRSSIARMLEDVSAHIEDADAGPITDQARSLYEAVSHELRYDTSGPCQAMKGNVRIESVYSVARAISGTPLRDSFHLGSTLINDYGRPYSNGFNNYSGMSGYASAGRFTLYARGEFQGAPSSAGYSATLAQALSTIDSISYTNPVTGLPYNQATIPQGPIASTTTGRVMEAYVSANVLNHEVSFGKQDDWLGPALGGGFAYSNNAENIYSFRINRVEPLHVPGLSYVAGPFRYEFLVGSLKGHIAPNDPWVHLEKVSFRPTENLELGFERTAIWGGKGHEPITLHTFLKSFFSFSSPSSAVKLGRDDPGARFGAFDFSYRLPYMRNWLTLYSDGEVHDDVSPIDAPRRAAWRPGLYLSHVPGVPSLDIRVEAVTTDPPVTTSSGGRFMYWETIQKQGYTNKGQIFGDWIGREAKGGQGWITYHLSGNEWLQVGVRNQKVSKDFIFSPSVPATATTPAIPLIQYGTTLNDINFQAVKRIGKDFEINGNFTYERYKAPIYLSGQQTVTTTNIQLTWFPERKVSF